MHAMIKSIMGVAWNYYRHPAATTAASALALVVLTAPLALANAAQSTSGEATAAMICGRCHNIGNKDAAGGHLGDGTPPAFVVIAQDPRMTPEALRRYIRFPHGAMDSVFITQREADALVLYIQSLKPDAARGGAP
jgi:mono/diheme cytochrome c family protein